MVNYIAWAATSSKTYSDNYKLMKQLKLLFALVFYSIVSVAQITPLAESPAFDEPEDGQIKLIQLKNGKTCYLNLLKKKIHVELYDEMHKKIADKDYTSKLHIDWKTPVAIFEVNNEVAVFLWRIEDRVPELYRMVIDGNTGEQKAFSLIATMDKAPRAVIGNFGYNETPSVHVVKDPDTNNYAAALFNEQKADKGKRFEIILFDGNHQETDRWPYAMPDEKFKYIRYVDMTFVGPDHLVALVNTFNGNKETIKSNIYLADIKKGATNIALQQLKYSTDLYLEKGIIKYSKVNNKLLVAMTLQSAISQFLYTNPFETHITIADAGTLKAEKAWQLSSPDAILDESKRLFGSKAGYSGVLQNLFILKDGSISVALEERALSIPQQGASSTILGSIAMLQYSIDARLTGSYYIPKSQWMEWEIISTGYSYDNMFKPISIYKSSQFKSFIYLNGPSKNCVFFNDVAENEENIKRGKVTTIKGISESDAFFYDLSGSEVLPKRNFVFGRQGNKEHQLLYFTSSAYDETNNLLAALKLEKGGGKQQVKIVWLKL
jgi:hypothetical protein